MVLAPALAVIADVAAEDAAGVDTADAPATADAAPAGVGAGVAIAPATVAALDEVSDVRGVAETETEAATGG